MHVDQLVIVPHSGESKDVRTTMIYTHVLNRPGLAVNSPLDINQGAHQVAVTHRLSSENEGTTASDRSDDEFDDED
jgi:hypothetical protein